tara:strand:+ start:146 stop:439 length:294 start_codon:yes stop_codon:yes gene_type:complete
MIYPTFVQISDVSGTGVQISSVSATGVQVSLVSASGSHLSRPFAAIIHENADVALAAITNPPPLVIVTDDRIDELPEYIATAAADVVTIADTAAEPC